MARASASCLGPGWGYSVVLQVPLQAVSTSSPPFPHTPTHPSIQVHVFANYTAADSTHVDSKGKTQDQSHQGLGSGLGRGPVCVW